MKAFRVPYYRQINEWYCGPAVLQMVLGAFAARVSQPGLAKTSGTNERHGTPRAGLVRALRGKGLRAAASHGRALPELERAVRDGKIVIVLYRELEDDEAHYAVFLGVSRGRVVLHDPWHGPRYTLPRAKFLMRWRGTAKKWRRWALIVDKRPVS